MHECTSVSMLSESSVSNVRLQFWYLTSEFDEIQHEFTSGAWRPITAQIDGPLLPGYAVSHTVHQSDVWNVLVPPRSLWARWIQHGSAHKNILQVHTHKRFVYFCKESSLASIFVPLALLLYVLWISHRKIWQALGNCCLGYQTALQVCCVSLHRGWN